MVIGIIGGGASGMAAALSAAENPEAEVVLVERQARLGRKLQATGNGRCNLTNLHVPEGGYYGTHPEFSTYALEKFNPTETLEWFRNLGLYTVSEPSGRVYPYSDQANSVVDVLRFALKKSNITVETGFEAERVLKDGGRFIVSGAKKSFSFDRLIVACGGLAGTKLGGGISGYKILKSFGHHCTRLRPALVQLKSGWNGIPALKGVRANCCAQIVHDGTVTSESAGEVQFTEYGLSGPVIFEISRDVCASVGEWICRMDLLPDVPCEVLEKEFFRRRKTGLMAEDLLTGILHNRLGRVVTKSAGINGNRTIAELSDRELFEAAKTVKCFEVSLKEPLGMDSAQVTAGGILTEEFNSKTMESIYISGLYACGEVLDIDGICGGYNLQWAWSSGRLAGCCAGKESV